MACVSCRGEGVGRGFGPGAKCLDDQSAWNPGPKICFGVQKWSEIHSARFQAPSPNDDSGPLFGLTSEAPFDFRVLWVRVTTEAAVATGIGHLFLPTPE